MNPRQSESEADHRLEEELSSLQPAALPEILRERIHLAMDQEPGAGQGVPLPKPPRPVQADPDFLKPDPGYRRSRLVRFLLAPSAAAALLVLLLGVLFLRNPSGMNAPAENEGAINQEVVDMGTEGNFIDPTVASFRPGRSQTILFDILDEGIVWTSENEAVRQFRYRFVESVSYRNPNDGSTLRMDIPREEVVRVPVETF